jgi:uncharacterized membrane-anchored protein
MARRFVWWLSAAVVWALVVSWSAPLLAGGPKAVGAATEAAAAPRAGSAGANANEAELEGALEAGGPKPFREGPATIELGHELRLDLPGGYNFVGQPQAAELMKRMGNLHNDGLLGLIASADENESWFVTVRYDEEGYVRDEETVDAGELLEAIKEGNEEANEERVKMGFKALHVEGWAEPPRYDRGQHHLVWALIARDDEGSSVNFNTRVLGRRGYVSLNLVTDPGELAKYRPQAAKLLAATHFKPGARYEDFDQKSDKVAEYGLAGLVLGGAGLGVAKLVKIGLLAKFWKLAVVGLIAGKKGLVLAGIMAVGMVKRLFGRKANRASE